MYERMAGEKTGNRNFYDLASAKVAIRFCKVKGHTGVTYNEKADQLAKQALGL